MRQVFILFATLAAGSWSGTPGASAQTAADFMVRCNNDNGQFSAPVQITGCTAAIESGLLDQGNMARVLSNRGTAYRSQGDHLRAIADYDRAITLSPQVAGLFNNRGYAFYEQGEHAQAITDFNEAIRLDPQYARAYLNRAVAYHEQGDYRQAIADYDQAIRLNPQSVAAFNNRGLAYAALGDPVRAEADRREADRLSGVR